MQDETRNTGGYSYHDTGGIHYTGKQKFTQNTRNTCNVRETVGPRNATGYRGYRGHTGDTEGKRRSTDTMGNLADLASASPSLTSSVVSSKYKILNSLDIKVRLGIHGSLYL